MPLSFVRIIGFWIGSCKPKDRHVFDLYSLKFTTYSFIKLFSSRSPQMFQKNNDMIDFMKSDLLFSYVLINSTDTNKHFSCLHK